MRSMAASALRPYPTSQTYRNLKEHGEGVLHVTDDVLLLAQAAVGGRATAAADRGGLGVVLADPVASTSPRRAGRKRAGGSRRSCSWKGPRFLLGFNRAARGRRGGGPATHGVLAGRKRSRRNTDAWR
ncbi:MAG: DUF447 family protein [Gemmataceae bacterium]